VIRCEEEPLVTGREGLNTLRVINSVKKAAATGQSVQVL
jgi:predicted dehydrogenase